MSVVAAADVEASPCFGEFISLLLLGVVVVEVVVVDVVVAEVAVEEDSRCAGSPELDASSEVPVFQVC